MSRRRGEACCSTEFVRWNKLCGKSAGQDADQNAGNQSSAPKLMSAVRLTAKLAPGSVRQRIDLRHFKSLPRGHSRKTEWGLMLRARFMCR